MITNQIDRFLMQIISPSKPKVSKRQCLFDWLPQHGGDQAIVSARLSSDKVMLRNSHNEIQMLAGTQLVALGRQKHLFRNYKAPMPERI